MKVLKDNYKKEKYIEDVKQAEPYPRSLICEECNSELEYEESDMRMGEYGCMHIDCPLCGYDNMLDDNEHNITLTVDNIEFPVHFHHTSTETCAVDCCDNETIKKYLYKAIDYFRKNKDEGSLDWGGHITGNLYINVHRYCGDENYEVTISNDFYSMYIPFEHQDY